MAPRLRSLPQGEKVYAECLLSLRESGILVCAGQRVPTWSASVKTPATEALMSFSGRYHIMHAVRARCWGGYSTSLGLHQERTLGRLCLASLDFSPCPFSFC